MPRLILVVSSVLVSSVQVCLKKRTLCLDILDVFTVINNTFRMKLTSLVGASTIPQINDAVAASKNPRLASFVVAAYVHAFQLGFKILAGIAVVQIILCLGLKRVVLTGGSTEKAAHKNDLEAIEMAPVENEKQEPRVEKTEQKEDMQKSEIEVTVR